MCINESKDRDGQTLDERDKSHDPANLEKFLEN